MLFCQDKEGSAEIEDVLCIWFNLLILRLNNESK